MKIAALIVETKGFNRVIITAIIVAGILAGLETSASLAERNHAFTRFFDGLILFIFAAEAVLKIVAHGRRPWRLLHRSVECFRLCRAGPLPHAGRGSIRSGVAPRAGAAASPARHCVAKATIVSRRSPQELLRDGIRLPPPRLAVLHLRRRRCAFIQTNTRPSSLAVCQSRCFRSFQLITLEKLAGCLCGGAAGRRISRHPLFHQLHLHRNNDHAESVHRRDHE